ncbi:MAG: pyruvate carboxylase, partial [Bacteroidetes bacterium SW_11_45_7]
DMAMFMTSNGYTKDDILEKGDQISFPESVISFFRGDLGQPPFGFPEKLQNIVLKDRKPYTDRPNAHMEPVDFDTEFPAFQEKFPHTTFPDFLSYKLYPRVFEDYYNHVQEYSDVSKIPTHAFFFGLKENEEITIEIDDGKTILVEMVNMSEPDEKGYRQVFFRLNGQTREIDIKDQNFKSDKVEHKKAEQDNEVGAPLQGKLTKILVSEGDQVEQNAPLFVIEAMKMESTITSPQAGEVSKIHLTEGTMVQQDDLVVELG